MADTDTDKKTRLQLWLKRSGIAVFLFFLIKGLIWLGIAAFIWMGFKSK